MFSLRTLFVVVTVAAVAVAALTANTHWLISTFVLWTIGMLWIWGSTAEINASEHTETSKRRLSR